MKTPSNASLISGQILMSVHHLTQTTVPKSASTLKAVIPVTVGVATYWTLMMEHPALVSQILPCAQSLSFTNLLTIDFV